MSTSHQKGHSTKQKPDQIIRRPQQSESKHAHKGSHTSQTSDEPKITIPVAKKEITANHSDSGKTLDLRTSSPLNKSRRGRKKCINPAKSPPLNLNKISKTVFKRLLLPLMGQIQVSLDQIQYCKGILTLRRGAESRALLALVIKLFQRPCPGPVL
ncbi:hypothetical protein WN943_029583 [Citrus x changshan-huyou]